MLYHLKVKMKQKDIVFFEEELPFEKNDFLEFETSVEGYDLAPLRDKFEENWLMLLEFEKKLGGFDYFSSSFCHIIDKFIENGEYKKASDELDNAFLEIGDVNNCGSVEIINLLYLKFKLLLKKNLKNQALEVMKQILKILKKNLTDNHPIFAIFYSIMAHHFQLSLDDVNALYLFKTSLLAYKRIYGPKNPLLAGVYRNLARIYERMNDEEQEYQSYKSAFLLYESDKYEFKEEFFEVGWKLANMSKNKGNIAESVEYALECIEILEMNDQFCEENLLNSYLFAIEEIIHLKDCSSALVFIDKSAIFLEEMKKKSYNTYQKLIKYAFLAYILVISEEKQEFFKCLAFRMQEAINEENKHYQNDEEYMQLIEFQTLETLLNETKLYEKFSHFIPHQLDLLFSHKDQINSCELFQRNLCLESKELKNSLNTFEKLLVAVSLSGFLKFYEFP